MRHNLWHRSPSSPNNSTTTRIGENLTEKDRIFGPTHLQVPIAGAAQRSRGHSRITQARALTGYQTKISYTRTLDT
jgi:hypothetical protein